MNEGELRKKKKITRAQMMGALGKVDPSQRSRWSAQITQKVIHLDSWKRADTVLIFLPMPTEVDTVELITASLAAGKTVGVPRMQGEEIQFHVIKSIDEQWEMHPFGLREPPVGSPVLDPEGMIAHEVCVITPGLCFDSRGWRLGFGRGYYDRFIKRCRKISLTKFFFLGLCFHIQVIEAVPTGERDCVLDGLMSERGIEFLIGHLP